MGPERIAQVLRLSVTPYAQSTCRKREGVSMDFLYLQSYGFNTSEVISFLRLINQTLDHPNIAADTRFLGASEIR